jgi:formate C-acetyltransferase
MALAADCHEEKQRLTAIAANCRRVPRHKPETFHEALQAIWMAQVVGEIQYGTHDVFAPGRVDQFLFPFFMADMKEGRLTEPEAIALVQEYFLKLSANIEPIPEAGTETNAVLGNSQHCVTIGGVKPDGRDGTNELSLLILKAYEQMKGSVNQLCVRIHRDSAPEFLKSTIRVFRKTSGIAIYNDDAVIRGLTADGFGSADARNYTIVGCVETCGQADTHPCPGGHELVLPAVLMLTLTAGRFPPPALGQQQGFDSGNPGRFTSFDLLLDAFRRQLGHQIHVLVRAAEGKDKAHSELLPAPYVSALMKGCIENVKDIVHGGAKYNFTSIDIRGLATLVDSLAAIRMFVYERTGLSLERITRILLSNFKDSEELRQRIITEAPKYGTGDAEADALGYRVIDWIYGELRRYRNTRGGRFRACYYSYGNHVIDGFMLGATPDGRLKGEPISNGVAPSNLVKKKYSPLDPMKTVALFEPEKVSSGVSLNLRFHPGFIRHENGLEAFSSIIKTYFALGGMHIQPNIVSSEILRDAQKNPDRHRDLVVKVSGYSAYFTDLGASIQEDIIARAEFGGQLPCS